MKKIEPLATIPDVREVDDAGGVHYEAVLPGREILNWIDDDLIRLEGNIRPDWQENSRMSAKTRRKVNNWAKELLDGNGVIGNLSIRVDPDPQETDYELEDGTFVLYKGHFDTSVDSQSRITALQLAAQKFAAMDPDAVSIYDRRFAVRIWIADAKTAARVAAKFNTEGEKVNETAAKWAHSDEFTTDDLANRLVRNSKHLRHNVEILKNSVSASSAKIFAFNTLSKAMQDHWSDIPYSAEDRDEQVAFLIDFWDHLVDVRPEFGMLPIEKRKEIRGSSLAGTALSIHGVVAVAARIWATEDKDMACLKVLAEPAKTGNGAHDVDYFSYSNPMWQRLGVLVSSVTSAGDTRLTVRSSFQTRKAVADSLVARVGF